MKYKTRGNSNPQGKPRVYFTGHPEDVKLYFKNITEVVFYDEDPEHPEDAENFISDLDRMQLIVLVMTSRYVYSDTFAHSTVFRHAMERHIPVLPVLEERGIERDFDKKCGDLQYLDPNAKDATALSFEEKLKKFLDSVLVGDELAARCAQLLIQAHLSAAVAADRAVSVHHPSTPSPPDIQAERGCHVHNGKGKI